MVLLNREQLPNVVSDLCVVNTRNGNLHLTSENNTGKHGLYGLHRVSTYMMSSCLVVKSLTPHPKIGSSVGVSKSAQLI